MSEESRLCGSESLYAAHDEMVAWLARSIQDGNVTGMPFPHFIIDNILPDQVFETLINDLPQPESMPSAADKGWASVAQYDGHRTSLFSELKVRNPTMWRTVERALLSPEVEQAAIDRFISWIPSSALGRSLRREVRLDCTANEAFFNPHTDHPVSFMKQLIYLTPSTYDSSLDTLLYIPRDPARRLSEFGPNEDFQADEYHHESPELHLQADRVRHQPNRMFAFLRSVSSLHGFGPLRCSTPRFLIAVHREFANMK